MFSYPSCIGYQLENLFEIRFEPSFFSTTDLQVLGEQTNGKSHTIDDTLLSSSGSFLKGVILIISSFIGNTSINILGTGISYLLP
jgi:hypothetical protein